MSSLPSAFLILNGAIVTILVIYFLLIKKPSHRPTKLKFNNAGGDSKAERFDENSSRQVTASNDAPRSLNVVFMYNGHSFDAYEALGVPAGSSFKDVTVAYKQVIRHADTSSRAFYDNAFDAIKQS